MKKKLVSLTLVIVLVLSLLPATALAADEDWAFTDNGDGTATITAYNGSDENVTTPDTLGGLPVTVIATNAFAGNTSIKNVFVSEGVTQLGDQRIVPDTVPTYENYPFYGLVFADCSALESISLPGTLEKIGAYTFNNCTSLETITVNAANDIFTVVNGVLLRDSNADHTYDVLEVYPAGKADTDYTTPDGVTLIATGAFISNAHLINLTLSDDVTQLGNMYDGSYDHPYDGTGVPDALDSSAFAKCFSLETISIPAGLQTIGLYSFARCYSINNIIIASGNTKLKFEDGVLFSSDDNDGSNFNVLEWYAYTKEDTDYTVPDTVTGLAPGAFEGLEHLQTLTFPGSSSSPSHLENLSQGVVNLPELKSVTFGYGITKVTGFEYCPKLSSVSLPDTLKQIGLYAFEWCDSLSEISLPEGLEEIGPSAFYHSGITEIVIPALVTSIGDVAFDTCFNLQKIEVAQTNANYKSIDGTLYTIDGKNLIQYPKGKLQKSFTVPNGVETIFGGVFNGAKLDEITLPNGLIGINSGPTFADNNLRRINIPSTVEHLGGEWAFSDNPNLKSFVVYSNSVVYSDENNCPAFSGSPNVVLYGNIGSTTQSYAAANKLPFSIIPSAVSISQTSVSLLPGLSKTLTAQTTPASGLVIWGSSDPTVATVDAKGNITAKVIGSTKITATCLDKTATCNLSVVSPILIGVSCTKTDATVYNGTDGTITATATGGNSGSYEYSINGGTNWQSSNMFSGLAAGSYNLFARDPGYPSNMSSCAVKIGQPNYMGTIDSKKIPKKAEAGTALTIVPPAAPKGYAVQTVTYYSSNLSVASVDAAGNVTFKAGGKVTIVTKVVSQMVDKKGKVKTKTATVRKTITVQQPVSSISLNLGDTTIARTQKVKLLPAVAPASASNKKVKWTSSNPKVASVSSTGVVTGKAGGTAVITCSAKDGSGALASCTVNVTPIYPTGLKMSKPAMTMKIGKSAALKATIAPKNTDFKTLTWTSSNPAVATVDAKGKVKAMASGTAVITAATSNGIAVSCTVTVP